MGAGWLGAMGRGVVGPARQQRKQAVHSSWRKTEGSSYPALGLKVSADRSSRITFEVQHFPLLRPGAGTSRSGSASSCWRR